LGDSILVKVKNERIKDLQQLVVNLRKQYAELRTKACLQQGVAASYIAEVNEMKRE
jgi:ribosomal protein L29